MNRRPSGSLLISRAIPGFPQYKAAEGLSPRPLVPKTIRNFHITPSAFFTWASREFEIASPMKAIPVPKYEEPPVEPFTKEQIEALLKACESCKEAQPIDRRKFTMRRATGKRDQAIILTVLDTGLRASELSALTARRIESD